RWDKMPGMRILRMFQRRKLRAAFGEYLSPEVIRRLLVAPKANFGPKQSHFQFLVILLDDTNLQEFEALIDGVVRTLREHRAIASFCTPSLLVAWMGAPFPGGNSPEARRELSDALLRECASRIKAAHGECDGMVGTFGAELGCPFSALIPG